MANQVAAQLIDGKAVAEKKKEEVRTRVEDRVKKGLRPPGLAAVLVGENAASQIYVRKKRSACEAAGILSYSHDLPDDTSQLELLTLIEKLNNDPAVDGILVQLPLPSQISESTVVRQIQPEKDVDGFHPFNMGRLAQGVPLLRPCTPYGIMTALENYGIEVAGKDAVVIGRSNIVGRPMVLELILASATTTVCHSRTADLQAQVERAEILVVAIGKAQAIPGAWVRPGAVVVDVGMNRGPDGKLFGDVEFETARERASWITPVPGGVGPMTVAMLIANTLQAAEHRDAAAAADTQTAAREV